MPELPDVAAYIRALETKIGGRTLLGIRLSGPFLLRTVAPRAEEMAGRQVVGLRRIGKKIVVALEPDLFIVLHLMIAGRLHWKASGAKLAGKNALAAFDFEEGALTLTEAGTKRRAALYFVRGKEALREHQRGGLEVMEADLGTFATVLARENHTLKRALTDPRLFSGIGNAYSDEILHRARLSPVKLTARLSGAEIERLHAATRSVLGEWIKRLCREADQAFPEKVTAFREGMAVHGRYGQPCPTCGSPVQRIVYAENECNYCATCQTEGRLLADRALSRLLRGDWPRTLTELEEKMASQREGG
jgi:formamidopyrimidine-DNA glycosylase